VEPAKTFNEEPKTSSPEDFERRKSLIKPNINIQIGSDRRSSNAHGMKLLIQK
jgi:hypothetical protein